MVKSWITFLFLFLMFSTRAQDISLPVDFRQHGLTEYNTSLFHPVFSMNGRSDETIALWARWQWQPIDSDPTNIFFSYRRRLNNNSATGAAFFQHNTERYLKTGGVVNYAYALELSESTRLAIGINLIGFKHKLTDASFQPGSPFSTGNDFVLQMSPGLLLAIDKFNVGISSENLFDYNFNTKERQTQSADRILLGLASYDIAIQLMNAKTTILRPMIYIKTIPGFDNQIGINTLLSSDKFWAQLGYNSHYGVSGGVGGRFFKKVAVGVMMEFGTDSSLKGVDSTFELVSAYDFGALNGRKKVVGFEMEDNIDVLEEQLKLEPDAPETEIIAIEDNNADLEELIKKDSIAASEQREQALIVQQLEQQRKQDSLAQLKIAEAEALKMVELEKAAQEEAAIKPEANEKYEEVATEDGLEPGYYLITNVFGTKKYFEAFMKDLTARGLEPKSFLRSLNKYNYVYLKRYDTMTEARKARDSNYDGRYPDKTWIFRVVGQ